MRNEINYNAIFQSSNEPRTQTGTVSQYKRMFKKILTEPESVSSTLSSQSTFENEAEANQSHTPNDIDCLTECSEFIEMLIKSLKGKKLKISSACLDLRAYYFKSSLHKIIPIALINNNNTQLALVSEKYFKTLYIAVLISYDSSFNHSLFKLVLSLLNSTLIQLNRLLLILIDFFIHYMTSFNYKKQLLTIKLIQSKLSMTNRDHMIEIANVMSRLLSTLTQLISIYKITPIGNELQSFFENIQNVTIEDIDLFFQGEVLRNPSMTSSSFSSFNKEGDDYISYISFSSIKSFSVNMSHYNNNYSLTPSRLNSTNKHYTLVLDLDETLIRFASGNNLEGKVLFRPHLFEFLRTMAQYFEIIVFTASIKEYADVMLNLIEAKLGQKVIDYRLYREHTSFINGKYVKDLSKIGRDLSRVVIVDNNEEAFSKQKDNGIKIASFLGIIRKDYCLFELGEILASIAKSKSTKDIRFLIKECQNDIKNKVSLN